MSKKLSKRQFRTEVFKGVFQAEFYDEEEKNKQLEDLYNKDTSLDEITLSDADIEAVSSKCKEIHENVSDIDKTLDAVLDKWSLNRIGKVELALLRVAVYEIKYEKTDAPIVINEVVEIAKVYGGEKSGKFINGVLAKLVD